MTTETHKQQFVPLTPEQRAALDAVRTPIVPRYFRLPNQYELPESDDDPMPVQYPIIEEQPPGQASPSAPEIDTRRSIPLSPEQRAALDAVRTPIEPRYYRLPDQDDLPETDNTPVENLQEHPQAYLLTNAIWPVLQHIHPDGHFLVGQDNGIYWNLAYALMTTDEEKVKGAVAPDWYYVPNVPPIRDGKPRRSYVLWHEPTVPLIAIEFVSRSGKKERDDTPFKGKFWVYEQLGIKYYAIYEVEKASVEVYWQEALGSGYQQMQPNERGHYPVAELGAELGIWWGHYVHYDLPWLRWWDEDGELLLISEERLVKEIERAEKLAAHLRALGVDPETLPDLE